MNKKTYITMVWLPTKIYGTCVFCLNRSRRVLMVQGKRTQVVMCPSCVRDMKHKIDDAVSRMRPEDDDEDGPLVKSNLLT
jgi:hypothetical protein